MITQKIIQNKLPFIILVISLVGLHIFWEYHYNNGVTTHHLLAREDLTGISNWWGLLSIPLLSWILIPLSKWLYNKDSITYSLSKITKGFIGGLVF
ncbi:hypothetical protein [Aquimarina sp. LLG6339-5]|uniref:hypothetical protein n=1 Tax=Aquimarina sp. LLG6339-5 TaxID=3160830 RepID=UPI00386D0EDF